MGCDCGDVDCDEIEVGSGGIGPDSVFYFLDRFGNGLDNKEERVAEIKAMVEKGDFDAAHRVLEIYLESAEALSEESDPELRDEARRSAIAIRNTLDELRESIPEGERERFYDEIIETERDFLTAVEISSRIRDLCVQLAELDPMEYSRMCQVGEDAPRWQRRLHRDLTADQKETAKEFVKIMKQCFKTSGQDCACEEIPFYDFSIACSRAAPLAIACDIDGEEIACDDLENLEMPELPDWLEPIWEDLEEEMMKAQYDMHMPRECVEAGVTSPRECGRVMIETHAPLECKSALLSSGCEDERECREICDAIMFELHTPQECIDGGITDPEECARFMDSFRGPGGGLRGPDCGRIEDPMERLECYDNRGNEFEDHYGPGEGYEGEGELTWQCRENRIHWPPDCETFMREEWPEQERRLAEEGEQRRENEEDWRVQSEECANSCDLENGWWDFRDENGDGVKECVCYATEGPGPSSEEESRGPGCDDCSSQCPAGANTDCVNDQCVCGEVPDTSPQYAEGEGPGEPGDFDNSGEAPTTDSSNGGEGGDSTETSSETTETTTESPITGEVVENPFLKYYRR